MSKFITLRLFYIQFILQKLHLGNKIKTHTYIFTHNTIILLHIDSNNRIL